MKYANCKLFDHAVLIFFLLSIFQPVLTYGRGLYKWVDETGGVHMTDELSQVPPQYRNQVEKKDSLVKSQSDTRADYPLRVAGERTRGNLKRIEVPYRAFEGTSRRIIIPVTFNDSVTAPMLLDTGSPGLLISPSLAGRLGLHDEIDGRLQISAGGIGGTAAATLDIVDTVKVGEAYAEFLPATITEIPSRDFEGLVGMDFLANYQISIDTSNNIIILDEMPPQSNKPGGHDEIWWRSNFNNFSGLRAMWENQLADIEKGSISSSEKEKKIRFAQNQYDEADKLCRKLERYARDSAVPMSWRR
jgi:hypothetical protein